MVSWRFRCLTSEIYCYSWKVKSGRLVSFFLNAVSQPSPKINHLVGHHLTIDCSYFLSLIASFSSSNMRGLWEYIHLFSGRPTTIRKNLKSSNQVILGTWHAPLPKLPFLKHYTYLFQLRLNTVIKIHF